MADIKKIVLTGGPCAGKTTALIKVIEHFSSLGYKVFTIPEVPTMFTQSGMDYLTKNKQFFFEGEKATLQIQMALEDTFVRLAETITDQPVLIVCDRGTLDISAYLQPQQWEEITAAVGWTPTRLRDERYDAVLHLVSAADGAEKYYTLATNAQRLEKPDEEGLRVARMLDKRVVQAWSGHPHMSVINNDEDFDRKMNRVIQEISAALGLPQPITQEQKFIVKLTGEVTDCNETMITQTYLTAEPGTEVRLRKREWVGGRVNVHTTKLRTGIDQERVIERPVSNALYESLLQQADPYRTTIVKRRRSFIYQGQFFELDEYAQPVDGLLILETKVVNVEDIKFPPFIQVVKNITGNTSYYNYNLAVKKK